MRKKYTPANHNHIIRNKIQNLNQKASVKEFYVEFRKLAIQAPNMNDDEKGLKSDIAKRVNIKKVTSPENVSKESDLYETNNYESLDSNYVFMDNYKPDNQQGLIINKYNNNNNQSNYVNRNDDNIESNYVYYNNYSNGTNYNHYSVEKPNLIFVNEQELNLYY